MDEIKIEAAVLMEQQVQEQDGNQDMHRLEEKSTLDMNVIQEFMNHLND